MPGVWEAVAAAGSYIYSSFAAVAAGSTLTVGQMAVVSIAAVGVGAGVGALMAPELESKGANLEWTANPDAPMHFAFGRVGVAGNIVDHAVFGPNDMYAGFVCELGSAGPIKSFFNFRADDHFLAFGSNGECLGEPYVGDMWVFKTRGLQPDVALPLPTGLTSDAAFPGWDSTRKMSGTYGYQITMAENSKYSAYGRKVPQILNVIEGLYCYDPRQDDTYPGGEGDCRLDDPDTWVWSRNPIIHGLKWSLGLWEGPVGKGAPQVDYQVGGIGSTIDGIMVSTFVEAANISDANGWTGAAWPSTDDNKVEVLRAFLKAGGASYAEIGGKIACIHRAAPRAPVFTVTGRDTAGPIELDTTSSKLNRINTIRPRFWSENNDWQLTAVTEVTKSEWRLEDGQGVPATRTRGMDYDYCDEPKQCRELAALDIANSREPKRGKVPLRPYMNPEPGDCFYFDEEDFELADLKCIVLNIEDDTDNDTIVVSWETETDDKYEFAFSQDAGSPVTITPTPTNPRFVYGPVIGEWALAAETFVNDGVSVPALVFTGSCNSALAEGVIFEFRPLTDPPAPWASAGMDGTLVERKEVTGITSGTLYEGAVSYRRANNVSERLILGPVTAGEISTGARSPISRSVLYPMTSAETSITIETFSAYMNDGSIIAIPGGVISSLVGSTIYGVFWREDAGFEAEVYPALTHMTTGRWIFIGWQATSNGGGDYPTPATPPGGWGGSGSAPQLGEA
ncbi:MAG: hypothetical protein EON87_00855 [Brevundimonas sp.]|nr:MAG: hypothetical protein EON87_00855 [Brevundimonas sp.]